MLMQIVFALMLMVITVVTAVAVSRDNPASQREAQQQVDNLRSFALATDRFISQNLDYQGKVTWSGHNGTAALRDEKTTPHSLRGVVLPRDWYAVVTEPGQFVLCAKNLKAEAIALLDHNFPAAVTAGVVPLQGKPSAVVFSHPNDFERGGGQGGAVKAKQWINQCER